MSGIHQSNNAFVAFSDIFKRQTDINTALADSFLNKRHPQTTPTLPQRQRNRVTVYHCNGMDIFRERITDQFDRWTFGFPADPQLISGWLAMNYGAAAAPTGTPHDEVQTISKVSTDITGGTFALTLNFEGRTGTAPTVDWDISTADLKSLLEGGTFPAIEAGDIASVTGDINAGFVITASSSGRLAKTDLAAFTVDSTNLTGGTIHVVETTKGANKVHAITRSTSPALPQTSFIIGFDDDSDNPFKYRGFACDAITIEAQNRQDLSVTIELIGSAKTEEVLAYVIPDCVEVIPITTADCRLRVDGAYLSDQIGSVRFERRNNIVVGNEAFPWDSKDLSITWRSPKPTETLSIGVYGSRGDDLYTFADQELDKAVILDLGNPGDRASISIPTCNLKLDGSGVTFDGELQRSLINVVGTPHYDNGINASSNVTAHLDQTSAFLTLPS